jgi:hypothetical protein
MFMLYDTSKELFYKKDYKPIPDPEKLNCTEINELLENLYAAEENAFIYHNEQLENALYNDIIRVQKEKVKLYVKTMSSGYIAGLILNTKYSEIDKAIYLTLEYIGHCDGKVLYLLGMDPGNMDRLLINCYTLFSKYGLTAQQA